MNGLRSPVPEKHLPREHEMDNGVEEPDERASVDLVEREEGREDENRDGENDRGLFWKGRHPEAADDQECHHEHEELLCRERTDDFVFDVDELGDLELESHGNGLFMRAWENYPAARRSDPELAGVTAAAASADWVVNFAGQRRWAEE